MPLLPSRAVLVGLMCLAEVLSMHGSGSYAALLPELRAQYSPELDSPRITQDHMGSSGRQTCDCNLSVPVMRSEAVDGSTLVFGSNVPQATS